MDLPNILTVPGKILYLSRMNSEYISWLTTATSVVALVITLSGRKESRMASEIMLYDVIRNFIIKADDLGEINRIQVMLRDYKKTYGKKSHLLDDLENMWKYHEKRIHDDSKN